MTEGEMDWKLAMEAERATLKSVVALLFALADLAELASGRSRAVRGFVLWILRRAENAARNLVTGAPQPAVFCQLGNSSAEAMRLAEDFRELARELDCQIALAFAICDDDLRPNDEARFGAGVLNVTTVFAFRTSARNALCLAYVPDTS